METISTSIRRTNTTTFVTDVPVLRKRLFDFVRPGLLAINRPPVSAFLDALPNQHVVSVLR